MGDYQVFDCWMLVEQQVVQFCGVVIVMVVVEVCFVYQFGFDLLVYGVQVLFQVMIEGIGGWIEIVQLVQGGGYQVYQVFGFQFVVLCQCGQCVFWYGVYQQLLLVVVLGFVQYLWVIDVGIVQLVQVGDFGGQFGMCGQYFLFDEQGWLLCNFQVVDSGCGIFFVLFLLVVVGKVVGLGGGSLWWYGGGCIMYGEMFFV